LPGRNAERHLSVAFKFYVLVAGPGIAPGLRDYEPRVRLYTTPHIDHLLLKQVGFSFVVNFLVSSAGWFAKQMISCHYPAQRPYFIKTIPF